MNYFIISSNSFGGAENRLIQTWLGIQKAYPGSKFSVVIPPQLFDQMKKRNVLYEEVQKFESEIVFFEFGNSFKEKQKQIKHLLGTRLLQATNIYLLLDYPFFYKKQKHQNLIFIYPGTSIGSVNNQKFGLSYFKNVLPQLAAILLADKIDVLDYRLYKRFKKCFFWKKIFLTKFGLSEQTIRSMANIDYVEKRNTIIFLGTFIKLKQYDRFLNSVPFIHQYLMEKNIRGTRFIMIGKGNNFEKVFSIARKLRDIGIDIEVHNTTNPQPFLVDSKVFCSLNIYNNYPSQSLFEGILAGCLPVATNCGNTKAITNPFFSELISVEFTSEEIAKACYQILKLSNKEFRKKSDGLIQHINERYSPKAMVDYYYQLSYPT
jgi:glycosyltransferase involved in cell wall biosynthesis